MVKQSQTRIRTEVSTTASVAALETLGAKPAGEEVPLAADPGDDHAEGERLGEAGVGVAPDHRLLHL